MLNCEKKEALTARRFISLFLSIIYIDNNICEIRKDIDRLFYNFSKVYFYFQILGGIKYKSYAGGMMSSPDIEKTLYELENEGFICTTSDKIIINNLPILNYDEKYLADEIDKTKKLIKIIINNLIN